MFYFIRHGEPDDSQRNSGIYQGFGVNLAGLPETPGSPVRISFYAHLIREPCKRRRSCQRNWGRTSKSRPICTNGWLIRAMST